MIEEAVREEPAIFTMKAMREFLSAPTGVDEEIDLNKILLQKVIAHPDLNDIPEQSRIFQAVWQIQDRLRANFAISDVIKLFKSVVNSTVPMMTQIVLELIMTHDELYLEERREKFRALIAGKPGKYKLAGEDFMLTGPEMSQLFNALPEKFAPFREHYQRITEVVLTEHQALQANHQELLANMAREADSSLQLKAVYGGLKSTSDFVDNAFCARIWSLFYKETLPLPKHFAVPQETLMKLRDGADSKLSHKKLSSAFRGCTDGTVYEHLSPRCKRRATFAIEESMADMARRVGNSSKKQKQEEFMKISKDHIQKINKEFPLSGRADDGGDDEPLTEEQKYLNIEEALDPSKFRLAAIVAPPADEQEE